MSSSKCKAIRIVLVNWCAAFLITFGTCYFFWDKLPKFHETVRGFLFSGFLTLGSFLLTTKTFVITRLQDGLFHTNEYDLKHQVAVHQNGTEKTGARNEGLRRLTEFLVWSVFSCMSVAVVQLILSTCESSITSAVSLSAAAASLFLVLLSWLYIRDFMHQYLELANSRPLPKQ